MKKNYYVIALLLVGSYAFEQGARASINLAHTKFTPDFSNKNDLPWNNLAGKVVDYQISSLICAELDARGDTLIEYLEHLSYY